MDECPRCGKRSNDAYMKGDTHDALCDECRQFENIKAADEWDDQFRYGTGPFLFEP